MRLKEGDLVEVDGRIGIVTKVRYGLNVSRMMNERESDYEVTLPDYVEVDGIQYHPSKVRKVNDVADT